MRPDVEQKPCAAGLIVMLVVVVLAAVTGGSWGQEPAPGQPADSPVKTISLPATAWKNRPAWQKAPSGHVEYLPFPDQEALGIARWGQRTLAGTWGGLLSSVAKDKWNIVPGLYGRAVRPLGERDGLLWLEEKGVGLLAVDKNWSIRRTVYTVQAHGISNFDVNSFWRSQEAMIDRYWWWDEDGNSLVEKSYQGEDILHIDTYDFPQGRPQWMAIDPSAVWLARLEFPEREFYSGPPRPRRVGHKQIIRVDRTTDKATTVDIHERVGSGEPAFVNLPNRILWIAPWNGKRLTLHQLDKKTMRVSTALQFAQPIFAREIVADGKNLWVFPGATPSGPPRVFSLRDFKPVALSAAGNLPPGSPAPSSYVQPTGSTPWYDALVGDTQRVWLSAPGPSLVELRDDGTASVRNLATLIQSPAELERRPSSALYGALHLDVHGSLLHLKAGETKVKMRQIYDPQKDQLTLFRANESRVWLLVNASFKTSSASELIVLTPDLALQCSTGPQKVFLLMSNVVPVGHALYFFHDHRALMRVDGTTGAMIEVASWRQRFADLQAEMQKSYREFARSFRHSFALPDNRLVFLFSPRERVSSKGLKDEGPALLLFYDPARDQWQEKELDIWPHHVVRAGTKFYGLRYDGRERSDNKYSLLEWRDERWELRGHTTLPDQRGLFVGTQRYLYFRTHLGLYRIEWSQMTKP